MFYGFRTLMIFIVMMAALLLEEKIGYKKEKIFEKGQISAKDAVLFTISIGALIAIMGIIIKYGLIEAVSALTIIAFSAILFLFTYLLLGKYRVLAALPPIFFISTYLLLRGTIIWDVILLNIFAVTSAIIAVYFLGTLFTWKSTLIFASLICLLDIYHVFISGAMAELATASINLKLPNMVILQGKGLGLGDLTLAGILTIQTLTKKGQKHAALTITSITATFLIFEILFDTFLYKLGVFPATTIIIIGWIPTLITTLKKSQQTKPNLQFSL
ncbi:MAG: hypothetical protein QXT06_05630 [Candidatus Bathyarchaeia archaeon]